MTKVNITDEEFVMPEGFVPEDFFADCYGITINQAEPKRITIKAEPTQAKYLRALPLHPSQQEEIHDNYSIFHYMMRNTYDLRERLLSHGSSIEVPKSTTYQDLRDDGYLTARAGDLYAIDGNDNTDQVHTFTLSEIYS